MKKRLFRYTVLTNGAKMVQNLCQLNTVFELVTPGLTGKLTFPDEDDGGSANADEISVCVRHQGVCF